MSTFILPDPHAIIYKVAPVIVFEGIDGSGKSSVIAELQELIRTIIVQDLPVPPGSILSFIKSFEVISQPGTLPLGVKLRTIIKEDFATLSNNALALLNMAARDEVISYIEARLSVPNHWFILDRHCLSTEVYQGGPEQGVISHAIERVHSGFTRRVPPAITFVLDIPAEVAVENIKKKSVNEMFDSKSLLFFKKVAEAYRTNYRSHRGARLIDANRSVSWIAEHCLKILSSTPLAPVDPLFQPLPSKS